MSSRLFFTSPLQSMWQWVWPQLTRFTAQRDEALYDRWLFGAMIALMGIGLVMVCSASMPVGARLFADPFHFAIRHFIYLLMALVLGGFVLLQPMSRWYQANAWFLLGALVLLIAVLLLGHRVNGSVRWLSLGPINIQASEPAKLFYFCYLASYLVRRHDEVRENFKGFFKPLIVFTIFAVLLVMQPDLGTVIVMLVTTIGMLFLAGARVWQFVALIVAGGSAVAALILAEPYRMRRITGFLHPWDDPFGAGYQLTQSLMAFGRGHLFGEGLGNSIQKLSYLPEAHTDFVVAVIAEELGFVGVCVVIALLGVIVTRGLWIGRKALYQQRSFEGFFAYGIAIWLCFQGVVNVGAAAGLLPTKGLTLPFVSYGGSSLIVLTIALAVLLRIDHELRMEHVQAHREHYHEES